MQIWEIQAQKANRVLSRSPNNTRTGKWGHPFGRADRNARRPSLDNRWD